MIYKTFTSLVTPILLRLILEISCYMLQEIMIKIKKKKRRKYTIVPIYEIILMIFEYTVNHAIQMPFCRQTIIY
jgi:hypothetical protein